MQEFLKQRVNLVRDLRDSHLDVHYADLMLITCAVLSACASRRWPGRGKDKQRFIELLVNHSPDCFHASWVSVPELLNQGLIQESQTPYGQPGNHTRIYCGEEIDCSFADATVRFPNVCGRDLRRHCYASLIYERLRCGYAHEYWHHANITYVPASRSMARVSYIGRSTQTGTKRMVSFHVDYLIQLAEHHVSSLPGSCSPRPRKWWIDEGQ